ncbi:hypothetical protein E4U41_005978 [Claviceps citrina]|nr:hypothetical protein E4U41_005978 [Claviceps citrina]
MFRSLAMPKPRKDGRSPRTRSQRVLAWICGPGREAATAVAARTAHQIRRNMVPRRVLSFPHFLFLFWVVILLWGERWVFESKVQKCEWEKWEKWPKQATPHHLVFVADPQITDPHSYPGRPWPVNGLTVLVTDNYLRRGHRALQRRLRPDSVFFLGDLFDGGREWRTRPGTQFVDPKWGGGRSETEKKWVRTWHRKYGEDFWLREYRRFSDIFFKSFNEGGGVPGPYQRGRKLVASLPGNHDVGFGAQIQVPVRDRFSAFFGDPNRVDVVGNHTIVSVDSVSLSAATSAYRDSHDLKPIYGPVHEFLDGVQGLKRKLAYEELRVWHGVDGQGPKLRHEVEDTTALLANANANADATPSPPPRDPGPGAADLPTILLTHVPLYRPPGTPCGPQREHWPPSKATLKEQQKKKKEKEKEGDGTAAVDATVLRDDGNAISVSAGYQYQNVLSEADSVKLIEKVGNVVHVFSGDDHDYCELVHSPSKGGVREITVKSFSMAMGVSTPGFLMVSLYNPVDASGRPVAGSPETTLQTHLCLLPNQFHTYMKYVTFVVVSLVLLFVRALLVPVLHLTPFALEPDTKPGTSSVLPVYNSNSNSNSSKVKVKVKAEPPPPPEQTPLRSSASGGGFSSSSSSNNPRWSSKKSRTGSSSSRRWDWGSSDADSASRGGPRIRLKDPFYDGGGGNAWRSGRGRGGREELGLLVRELWTTTWRLGWMTVLFWAYLAREV